LVRALDQFRVNRLDGLPTLVAGYPWFTDWSRDTLISLPALSISGFPGAEVKAILTMLSEQRLKGLLPNRFSDSKSTPEYNTIDGTLWFFIAARDFMERFADRVFLRDVLYPAARDILDWHHRGTFDNIKADPEDRLLSGGTAATQLTWMDAKVGEHAITPRSGKPVEVNALWYNALKIAGDWAAALGFFEESQSYAAEADQVRASFQRKFWNSQRGCLYDVVTPYSNEASVRPNQLAALALPYALLDSAHAQSVVNIVREKLLTPTGLRTLEAGDEAYRPRFEGDMASRDSAYHQGTVWPWLIGPFIAAYLYAFGRNESSRAFCKQLIGGIEEQLSACCLGSLSEVYDAEAPQRPAGCPAQLWSVAQLIIARELVEDSTV